MVINMSVSQLFVDSLGAIVGQGPMVRIDLNQIIELPKDNQKAQVEVFSRLVMSVETFLNMHESMSQVVSQMESKGIIKKNENKALPASNGKASGKK
jgi:hypothetical protein